MPIDNSVLPVQKSKPLGEVSPKSEGSLQDTEPADLAEDTEDPASITEEVLIVRALQLDPVVWAMAARRHPADFTLWRMLAETIVVLVLDLGMAAIEAGRELFNQTVLPAESPLWLRLSDRTYDAACAKAAQYKNRQWSRMIDRMVVTDPEFRKQGLPIDGPSTLSARVRRLVREARSTLAEELATDDPELALELSSAEPPVTESMIYDTKNGHWFRRDECGNRVGPFQTAEFTRMVQQATGLSRKRAAAAMEQIQQVHDVAYVYDSGAEVVDRVGVPTLNLYEPTDLVPEGAYWRDFYLLVRNLCGGNKIKIDYLLDSTALPLQSLYGQHAEGDGRSALVLSLSEPQSTQVAIVLRGETQGSGKDTYRLAIQPLYGKKNVRLFDQDSLDSKFNDELDGALLIWCSEVISSENRNSSTKNRLKQWITDDEVKMEKKYHGRVTVKNHATVFFASNDERPVMIESKDRRHVVIDTMYKLPQDVACRIYADLNGPRRQLAAFFRHLLTRRVKIERRQILDTPERQRLIDASLPSEIQFVRRIFEDGWPTVALPWAEHRDGPQMTGKLADTRVPVDPITVYAGEKCVRADVLNAVYDVFCRQRNIKPRGHTLLGAAIKNALKDEGVPPERAVRKISMDHNGKRYQPAAYFGLPMEPVGADAQVIPMPSKEAVGEASDNADLTGERP